MEDKRLLMDQIPPLVVILGGDQVAGRALELLLRSVGYNARFLTKASLDEPRVCDEVRILLFEPGLSADRRETYTAFVTGTSTVGRVLILELASIPEGERAADENLIPWPIGIE
jgi:hypothetical protein